MGVTEVDWGVEVRPYPGETVSGDAGLVVARGGVLFVSLLDAAGHGAEANEAVERTRDFLVEQAYLPLEEIPASLHEFLAGDRGVVAAFGEIDRPASTFRLVSIGNIITRLYGDRAHEFVGFGGLIGVSTPPAPRLEEAELNDGDIIVMHSDGVSRRARLHNLQLPEDPSAALIAAALVDRYGKDTDDASCLVAKVHCREQSRA